MCLLQYVEMQYRPRLTEEEYEVILKLRQQQDKNVSSNYSGLNNSHCKILFFDLETSPLITRMWSKWQNGVNDNNIIKDWGVLCWSAKWLFDDTIYSGKVNESELETFNVSSKKYHPNDERIMKSLWSLIDEADVIVAHNLKKFDEKKANTKFLKYGFGCPSPYQTIDTLLHLRKRFALTSNRLDYAAKQFFDIEGKLQTENNLWVRCMDGDYDALKYMSEYCDQDVKVLEDVYLLMRGWIKPHPNVGLQALSANGCCPVCSSEKRKETKTPYRTYVNEYTAYRCDDCSHIYRERRSNTPIASNKNLKVSTPR